jgi:hypothetical protein
MAFQKSEYKEEFENKDPEEVTFEYDRPFRSAPQNYLLQDEITSGPTKVVLDYWTCSQNSDLYFDRIS